MRRAEVCTVSAALVGVAATKSVRSPRFLFVKTYSMWNWFVFALTALTALTVAKPHGLNQTKPQAHVRNGTYFGTFLPGFHQDLFLGIPYAKPPTGTYETHMSGTQQDSVTCIYCVELLQMNYELRTAAHPFCRASPLPPRTTPGYHMERHARCQRSTKRLPAIPSIGGH
jgi:hypothetical protein